MIAIDSEFQSLIPPLSDDEYERLEKSILAEGVRNPIITWNGTIIDGHNRYHICDEHGIECPQVEHQFESRDAAKIWIIENQFGRRNLSKYDRSVLALKLEPLYAAEAKRRVQATQFGSTATQKSAEPTEKGETRDKVAAAAGVSHDTIRKVKVIEQEAAKGNETAVAARDAVRSGGKSIHRAFTEIQPKLCSVCGKPIAEGDCYDHDQFKHRACAYELERQRSKPKSTDDGRRICTICGEPIDEGDAYPAHPWQHYECGKARNTELQRLNRDADSDLRSNEAEYSVASLVTELTASVNDMRDAIAESIQINEGMGVRLTSPQKRRLNKAIDNVLKAIDAIMDKE